MNPYDSPHADLDADVADVAGVNANVPSLRPIWYWLGVAVAASLLRSPADPLGVMLAMYFGLSCFLTGALLHPASAPFGRLAAGCMVVLSIALWIVVWPLQPGVLALLGLVYAIGSVLLGYRASKALPVNRARVLWSLAIAYSVGVLLVPAGCLVLTVPAVLFANRNHVGRTK